MVKKLSTVFLIGLCYSCSSVNTIETNANYTLRFKDNLSYKESVNFLKTNKYNYSDISKEMKIFEVEISNKQKSLLEANSNVKYLTSDQKLNIFDFNAYNANKKGFNTKAETIYQPNDNLYSYQWNMPDIKANSAWSSSVGKKNIIVAVIDSGVDPDHPDLKDNLLPLIDVWAESRRNDFYNYRGSIVDYTGRDGNGHGTHVSGIIGAAIDNNIGVAGVVGNIKILPIKSSNYRGETYSSTITRSILRAIEEKANVINISIGGPKTDGTQSLEDAVELAISKGIVFISATGNESDRKKGLITDVTIPAAYPGVLAVGASTEYNKVSNYSNGGKETSLVAPGGGGLPEEGKLIYSTFPTYRTYLSYSQNIIGPYALLSGTSMAAPHVAGAAALVLSEEPNLTVQKLRVRLLSSTTSINGKGFNEDSGYGKLNIYEALRQKNDDKKDK